MLYRITVVNQKQNILVPAGTNLLQALRTQSMAPDAPCGGNGHCGKCKVLVDGKEVLACQTPVDRDMTVTLPEAAAEHILSAGVMPQNIQSDIVGACALAFDIGTTTVVGYLLDAAGTELASASMRNPQSVFGADVISRIRHALSGDQLALTNAIRNCVQQIINQLLTQSGISSAQVSTVSLVGNPAMQQLFLGISPKNLAQIPYAPVLTQPQILSAKAYIPTCENAQLLVVPNIGGFVGADTVACVAATQMDRQEELSLLVDIGTNGEMVLGNQSRMVACSTAAGPALEGANIQWGMRAVEGAIDHVTLENGQLHCSVIGDTEAVGICGSGLIDAIACALNAGLIDERGRIRTPEGRIHLTETVYLTQEDIRQVQLAKGAIAAGIELLAEELGVSLHQIQIVYLAGAFGTYMDAASACRIGLIPTILASKITAIGNAAGSGAKLFACNHGAFVHTQQQANQISHIDLASLSQFNRCFARNMRFPAPVAYWMDRAISMGFSEAAPLDPTTLIPRSDVRAMCAENRCGAYKKNWTCPPHCGTLDECGEKLKHYSRGIVMQTVGVLEKTIDTRGYRRAEERHLEAFHQFSQAIRDTYPQALCLGSGGCRICKQCAYPAPCRFPEKAHPSMEGYGLFVTQVCKDNGLAYYRGERTVTYTACVLF